MKGRSLSFRLLTAMLAVVAVGSLALFITARLLGPQLFDTEVQRIGQRYGWGDDGMSSGGRGTGFGAGQGASAIEDDLNDAFTGSLNVALVVALGAGALTAVAGAVVVSRRILLPLNRMRIAVGRMAEGHYGDRIPEPEDRELADLARDVNALGDALAATEERRARLVSDLAHEMRTPITSIDGFLEGMEDGVFESDGETLAAMRSETRRLQRLAADLGALSRAEEEAFELQVEDADLGSVAVEAARALGPAFSSKGLDLDIGEMVDAPVRVDVDRMAQVFSNLLGNAMRHTGSGGTVSITAQRRRGAAVVIVADTGEGIAPDDLPRVFDRFFRGEGRSGASGGSGIGLTIARSIARAHGGDLRADSGGIGAGSAFTVTVPLRD